MDLKWEVWSWALTVSVRVRALFGATQKKGVKLSGNPFLKMLWSAFPHCYPLETLAVSPCAPKHSSPLYLRCEGNVESGNIFHFIFLHDNKLTAFSAQLDTALSKGLSPSILPKNHSRKASSVGVTIASHVRLPAHVCGRKRSC